MNEFKKKLNNIDNILSFETDDLVTNKVIDFYNISPFPNYKDDDDKSTINYKGEKNIIARYTKNFIGFNKKILEVGCGTGQLSSYFAIGTNNKIFALDPTLKSISLAQKFCEKNQIKNIKFINADIFDDIFNDEVFDFIWSNGVLHHTKDPYLAFKILTKYLKQNGYILIGLYNKFGRLRTIFRRFLYKIFGKKIVMLLDPTLRNLKNDEQINSWIRDQYMHPVESLHTIDEVIKWFDYNNIEFISSIPSCDLTMLDKDKIFHKQTKGNFFYRFLSQIMMVFGSLGSDGGLFILIGKKRPS